MLFQEALICKKGVITTATRLETLNNRLAEYLQCEDSILNGAQSYALAKKTITRANLQEVAEMIKYLEKEIAQEESRSRGRGRNLVAGAIPIDI
ncbi:DUF6148 family protein [Desulfosporosinus sp. FKB]|uniref:DUF6148 family protein n=1 Tax=Desulfosporosinus sp. FKB TaxID=1969835 RepID=UPI001482A922|nr:DUF6148 family protein [Desulfosporosinus sp. FKB]